MPKIGDENPSEFDDRWPEIQHPQGGMAGPNTGAWEPQQNNAFDEVLLKGSIKEIGESAYTEKCGWIYWRREVSSSSSGSSSSGSSSSGSSSSSFDPGPTSGSPKDSCIIPVKWGTGWTALYCVEAADVIFIQQVRLPLRQRKNVFTLDTKFFEACLLNSVGIYGACGDRGPVWGEVLEHSRLVIRRPWLFNCSRYANILLVGLRKDCKQNPWPEMTREQFEFNEERIRNFLPREKR